MTNSAVWPSFRFDCLNSGAAPFTAPRKAPEIEWAYDTGGSVRSPPGVDGVGGIYFGDDAGILHALTTEGELRWSYPTEGSIVSAPSLSDEWDGVTTVYFGSTDGHVYMLNAQDGKDKAPPFNSGAPVRSSTVVRNHLAFPGTSMYFGNDLGTFFNVGVREGEGLRFTSQTEGGITATGAYAYCTIVVASNDGSVRSLNPHNFPGSDPQLPSNECDLLPPQAWEVNVGSPIHYSPVTAFAAVGFQYVVPSEAGLHAIVEDDEGAQIAWTFEMEDSCATDPAVSHGSASIYVGSRSGVLHSVNMNTGSKQWSFNTTSPFASPTLDNQGNIYLGTHSGDILALTPEGQPIWQINIGSAVRTPMSITRDGKLLVGTDAGVVLLAE